jgi:hypothetical protein
VLKLVKFIFILILTGVINSSADHPKLHDKRTQDDFLLSFPQSYYLTDINPASLSLSTIGKLTGLNDPEINFVWLQHLVERGEYNEARLLWSQIPSEIPSEPLNELVDLLVMQQRWQEITRLAEHVNSSDRLDALLAMQSGVNTDKLTKAQLDYFAINTLPDRLNFASECKNSVLLLADHFSAYQHLKRLRAQYIQNPEPEENSFCLSKVFYLGNTLDCKQGFKGFASCNIKTALPETDFHILMTKNGLANVRESQMTLTLKSDINVMVHELMHFSGFEDEYPIYGQKAKWLCNSEGLKAPNLFVGTAEQAPVGWVEAKTCQNGILDAYKPSPKWSKMQFQELPLSEQYRQLWQKKIHQDWLFEEQNVAKSTSSIIN